jgi:hypothetical protein
VPALGSAGSDFLAYGAPRPVGVTPGDHLQTAYNLWLPGHQLARASTPWLDPYSFQPEADERTNFAAWPFAVVFGPLHALLGTVGAWNAFVFLSYLGAGGCAALWLRALGLPLGAALAGGLAFALAPYRSLQTAGGHLLGPISMLLPLSLYGLEARRTWLAAAALASIPLSGQVHLALAAIPFVLAYGWARGRWRPALAAGGAAVAAGLLVYLESIRGTVGGDRGFDEVERYSAEPLDFLARHARHGFETFAFLGWLTPVLAAAGLLVLARRDRRLALVLGLGVAVPVVAALGANTPLYEPAWRVLPGLGQTRVPERLLPVACLALAALAALALARLPWRAAAPVALVLIAVDLRLGVTGFRALGADEHNPVYAALREEPPGRLLERPVLLPDEFAGSVYSYYAMQAPRERPSGYSTTAPPEAVAVLRRLRGRPGDDALLRSLGVRYVVLVGRAGPTGYRAVR